MEVLRLIHLGLLRRVIIPYAETPPNDGMHPTRSCAALILNLFGGRVMPGVGHNVHYRP